MALAVARQGDAHGMPRRKIRIPVINLDNIPPSARHRYTWIGYDAELLDEST